MAASDFVTHFISTNTNALHLLLESSAPLGDWVLVRLEDRRRLIMLLATEVSADPHPEVPTPHWPAIVAEVAKSTSESELLLFTVAGENLTTTRIERARIQRELGPRSVVDARNHFPFPWPKGWHGPYALESRDTYRIDTPDCQLLSRVQEEWDGEHLDDDGRPRHLWLLEIGVTRSMDPAVADDHQIAAITARFRHCGPWVEQTHLHERRHPSRRIFAAEIGAHPKGTPWPEVLKLPDDMIGPPPGWEPVGSLRARPLVFRIEGTELCVEWAPPPGVTLFDAATGRASEPSSFIISAGRRAPTDEEVAIVFAMIGRAKVTEEQTSGATAKSGGRARTFLSTAAWLRRMSGLA